MKRYILIGFLSVFSFSIFSQQADTTKSTNDKAGYKVSENEEEDIVTDEVVKKGKPDTTTLNLGKKEINIIDENGETSIKIKDKKDTGEEEEEDSVAESPEAPEVPEAPEAPDFSFRKDKKKDKDKFKGHWAGFEFGLNNYVDKDFSLQRTAETEFLDLNTGKSWNFNLNFAQYSFPILFNRFGLVTGMGFEWSNYHFQNNNTIQKLDGEIQALDLTVNPVKNRFQTTYLTVPLLAEVQLFKGDRDDRLYFSGGIIGGIKLFSNTKIKYYDDGSKEKKKNKGDFYLNPLRYGLTARVGYKMVKLYANYYITPLFIDGRGPELNPVAAGLVLSF